MVIVRFAHSASVAICLYALLIILLFPFNTFAQKDYGSSPRGFAFDTQLCYRECDKVANTKDELPCCRELCRWKSCVSNAHDPGADRTECQPHYQIYENCSEKNRAAKKPPTPNPFIGTWVGKTQCTQPAEKEKDFKFTVTQGTGGELLANDHWAPNIFEPCTFKDGTGSALLECTWRHKGKPAEYGTYHFTLDKKTGVIHGYEDPHGIKCKYYLYKDLRRQ